MMIRIIFYNNVLVLKVQITFFSHIAGENVKRFFNAVPILALHHFLISIRCEHCSKDFADLFSLNCFSTTRKFRKASAKS